MGLSSSKQTTKNESLYKPQIEGSARDVKSAYDTNAPKIQDMADQFGAMVPSMLDDYRRGDPAINAGTQYITDTLGSDPTNNPYLQQMIDITGDSVRNQTQASMGTRGQTGGSDYAALMTERLARNESGLRYQDYDQSMNRKAQAAGMAPGMAAGRAGMLTPALSAAQAASGMPMNAAALQAAATGGLLGQYQKTTQKGSPNWGLAILQGAQNAAQSFAGGG